MSMKEKRFEWLIEKRFGSNNNKNLMESLFPLKVNERRALLGMEAKVPLTLRAPRVKNDVALKKTLSNIFFLSFVQHVNGSKPVDWI